MSWIAEILIQGFWEGVVEAAYRKWGWLGGGIAFVLPPVLVLAVIWMLVR